MRRPAPAPAWPTTRASSAATAPPTARSRWSPARTLTCTITNTRQPTLTVNKVCDPTTDTGTFNLRSTGGTTPPTRPAAPPPGPCWSATGGHTVGETAGTGTSLGNYSTAISGGCAADGTITLAGGQNATCTITNTRLPTLTVNKVCNPTTDTGKFNLQIDGVTKAADALCGGTTGAVTVSAGTHTVTETAGTGNNLANYTSVTDGACASNGSVTLTAGQNLTCTITNTRNSTLTVNKACNPAGDTGKFNLQIDGVTKAADALCGGTTGAVVVSIGTHTVAETAGTGTNLANYTSVTDGACAANGSVTIAAGQNLTCTITNTHVSTLTVNKVCNPTTDTGKFNLQIDGVTKAADALCGGTTGAVAVSIGAHTVAETAGTGNNLANYTTVTDGASAGTGSITLAAGQNATCTITNTHVSTLTVNKVCNHTTDTGKFNLKIDAVTKAADAACGTGTAGPFSLPAPAPSARPPAPALQPGQLHTSPTRLRPDGAHPSPPAPGPARSPTPTPPPSPSPRSTARQHDRRHQPQRQPASPSTDRRPRQNRTGGGPSPSTVTGYTVGATCTATETIPTGYSSAGTCSGAITGAPVGTGACTITNTENSATFTVSKAYSDTNTTPVTVTLTCTSGSVNGVLLSNSASATPGGPPASFTVSGYTGNPTCTATETAVPAGNRLRHLLPSPSARLAAARSPTPRTPPPSPSPSPTATATRPPSSASA